MEDKNTAYMNLKTNSYMEVKTEVDTNIGHINIINLGEEVEMEWGVKNAIENLLNVLPPNKKPRYYVLFIDINKKFLQETLGGGS